MARLFLATVSAALLVLSNAAATGAQEDWVIRSFDAAYIVNPDGTVTATEDLRVDFGGLERHGIFRDIPVEYEYDGDENRLIEITDVSVSDGSDAVEFELNDSGPNLRIKIGDPDTLVSGEQRYVINYSINDGLNPFADHDELYWNVTGNDWEATIESASAFVVVPEPGIEQIACYQGPTGSTAPCSSSGDETTSSFEATEVLPPGSGLTIVVGLRKGLVTVAPPVLTPASDGGPVEFQDLFKFNLAALAATAIVGVAVVAAMGRLWWVGGRDRWYGNMYYINEAPDEETKPLMARETIVVEYQPPEVADGRRLRPAEIGLLLDERADTLDVSATIVHLAVRRHLVIKELPKSGFFGMFKSQDYELIRDSGPPDGEKRGFEHGLRPYESKLLDSLFESGPAVKLSELKNKFHEDLAEVKSELYDEAVNALKMFPANPDKVRMVYRVAGIVVTIVGGLIGYGLGTAVGGALLGVPVVLGGVLLFALAHMMPRRTASGRMLYRRCLGFRLYMTKAEKERQTFAEKANLFEEYLPYAIVYGCVEKWAKAFEGLGLEGREMGWYAGTHGFAPVAFAESLGDFSSSISGVMASTPGGKGGSGFGGGGGSGGGGGGGGGGSW